MVRKSSIIPTDISSSREYYGLNNSQDIYKGTSFKFSGEWTANTHYFNDEYIIDFVTHIDEETGEMAMWACNRNHLSDYMNEPKKGSRFWSFVMSGATGATGQVYIPSVDSNGNLVFKLSDEPANSTINIASIKGEDGRDGINGVDGKNGKDGKVYIPSVKDGIMTFTLSDSGRAEYKVNINDFKGEKGDSGKAVELKIEKNIDKGVEELYYREEGSKEWIKLGKVGGAPGRSPRIAVINDNDTDLRNDRICWKYDGWTEMDWVTLCYLDDLRGDSISDIQIDDEGHLEVTTSYKRRNQQGEILEETSVYKTEGTVLPEFRAGHTDTLSNESEAKVSVNKTGDPKVWELDFAIPRGKDATVSVSRTVTVSPDTPAAVINEGSTTNAQLRFEIPKGDKGDKGDENIHIGPEAPNDITKIWYDTDDYSVGELDSRGIVYSAYSQAGGDLREDEFYEYFIKTGERSGFNVVWRASFEDLGDPTEDKLGILWVVNSGDDPNNMYEEWVVVNTATTGDPVYKWELWGSGSVSDVNLDNYYTKDQVNQYVTNEISEAVLTFDGKEIDASNWE